MKNQELIIRAAAFADAAHREHRRKYTNDPYIYHPMRVAGLVTLQEDADADWIAAAWLHDVLEDCEAFYRDGITAFPEPVVHLVRELTNPSKKFPKLNRAARKKMDREHLANVSAPAKIIKLCDRFDNLRELAAAPEDFIKVYVEESVALVRHIRTARNFMLAERVLDECHKLVNQNEPQP